MKEPAIEDPLANTDAGGPSIKLDELSNTEPTLFDKLAEHENIPPSTNITDQALFEMTAIPLYFPISYSLIKPYVRGFEVNGLDAPSLKEVSVDNDWQPGTSRRES
jgi:hypothetical protein